MGKEEQISLPELDANKMLAEQNQASALQGAHSEEQSLVNQILGQAQLAGASEDFFRTVRISKLAFVKENKLYKAIAGQKSPHGAEKLRGTWEEFCNLLGRSVDQIDRDIANLRAFGEEALESMSRMGIGYREMRQYRRLPEDEKTALLEVAKSGDKDSFLDLAEEIIARHAKEKEALAHERDEARADYDAQGERLRTVTAERDSAQLETEKIRRRIQTAPADEVVKQLQLEASGIAVEFTSLLRTKLRPAVDTLLAHADSSGVDHRGYIANTIRQIELDLGALRDAYDLPEGLGGIGAADWLDDDKLAALDAHYEAKQTEKGL
jgi:hypothetical protein